MVMRDCTRNEGRSFEAGPSNHCKLLSGSRAHSRTPASRVPQQQRRRPPHNGQGLTRPIRHLPKPVLFWNVLIFSDAGNATIINRDGGILNFEEPVVAVNLVPLPVTPLSSTTPMAPPISILKAILAMQRSSRTMAGEQTSLSWAFKGPIARV